MLLKAVGLAAALAQSGIVPPVGAGSRLPVFRRFFADIGDRQSIAASLSTFSAHVRMLRRILDEADDATLVLLDEVGSGTDPAEGAALAAATLVVAHGARHAHPRDHAPGLAQGRGEPHAGGGERIAPVRRGDAHARPTASSRACPAARTAWRSRAGWACAPAILADAEARVPDAERSLDALLAAVEERQRELAAAQAALAERVGRARRARRRLASQQQAQAAREAELKRREKEAERSGRQQARAYLLEARQRVEEALGAARGAADDAAREARRLVEEGIREQGEELERAEKAETAETAESGGRGRGRDRVRLASGGAGQVLEIRADGKLVVAIGAMKMVVDADQATRTAGQRPLRRPLRPSPPSPSALRCLPRDRPPRHDRRRGRDGDGGGGRRGGAGGAAVPAHHSWHGNRGGAGAGAAGRLERPAGRALRLRPAQSGRHRRHDRGVLGVSMIPDEIVEQVRDSADLVGIIGEAVELKRTGSDYRGPCPFHGGTHRNFAVIPKKGRYYCFVCHESGDVFSWLMKRLGMDYPDRGARGGAAGRASRSPSARRARAPTRWSRCSARSRWRRTGSPASSSSRRRRRRARDYLEGRDVPLETAALYGLGYAPPGKALPRGHDASWASRSRCCSRPDSPARAGRRHASIPGSAAGCCFRSTICAAGSSASAAGCSVPGEPKYLNSPENADLPQGPPALQPAPGQGRHPEGGDGDPGRGLLRRAPAGAGRHRARRGAARAPRSPRTRATLLRRFAPAAILLYDSDQAGLRATFRAGDELLRHGVRVRVATMPAGEDPDTLVRRAARPRSSRCSATRSTCSSGRSSCWSRRAGSRAWIIAATRSTGCCPTIRAAADPVMRDLYLRRGLASGPASAARCCSSRWRLGRVRPPASVCGQTVGGLPAPAMPTNGRPGRDGRGGGGGATRRVDAAERDLLRVLVKDGSWVARAVEQVAPDWFETPELREMYEALCRRSRKSRVPDILRAALADGPARLRLAAGTDPRYGAARPGSDVRRRVRKAYARPGY